jgi:tetratricopeptide (TPR) repeat protein
MTEALAMREMILGPDHFVVGTTLAAIANNQGSHRSAKEREALLRRAEAIQRKHPGYNDDELAQTLMILGFVVSSDDRREEAGALLNESIDIRRQLFGGPHPHLAESLYVLFRANPEEYRPGRRQSLREHLLVVREVRGLANAKLVAAFLAFTGGRIPPETLTEDLRLVRDVFADLQKVLPADSPDLAVAQLAFASALELAPDSASEAQSLAQDAINRLDRARENDRWPHRDVSPAMQWFAFRARAVGRLDYAVAMGEALRADVKFGSVLSYGPPIARALGYTYHDLGRYDEAASLLEVTVLPERSPWRPRWRSVDRAHLFVDTAFLGDSYRKLGRMADSRRILEAGLARKVDALAENDWAQGSRAAVRGELAYTAMAEGRFAEAEALFRAALKEYESMQLQNQWEKARPRGRIVIGLGQVLARQGKLADAELLLVEGITELIARRETFSGDPTLMLREALDAVVQFYRDVGKPEQVAEWEAKKEEL